MTSTSLALNFEITNLLFSSGGNSQSIVVANGVLRLQGRERKFYVQLSHSPDGTWFKSGGHLPYDFLFLRDDPGLWQPIIKAANALLITTNMWTVASEEAGAKMAMNQQLVPTEFREKVHFSARLDALDLPDDEWKTLWRRIENRLKFDPHFRIAGYDLADALNAINHLRHTFDSKWILNRYRESLGTVESLRLSHQLPRDARGWFPAFHLARTALGAICVDPAWNYLVDIGLAIKKLEKVPRSGRLIRELAHNPGSQHNLCMAAEFLERGILEGLEVPTGIGEASNDLLVRFDGRAYAVEVKEFLSSKPIRNLLSEITEKVEKLPPTPDLPVIFHVIVAETDGTRIRMEADFFKSVSALADSLPPQISGIVAGTRFVDAAGGPVKRDTRVIALNPRALRPSELGDLESIFAKNFAEITYPQYGVSSFIEWGKAIA